MGSDDSANKIFYGWWLMLVSLVILSFGYGTTLYLYGVLISVVGEEFESPRSIMMFGVSSMLLLTAFMSPKVGSLLDKYPVRKIIMAGACILGSGFLMLSITTNIYQVVFIYSTFIALGMTILSPLTSSVLMTRWFDRHRGFAVGCAALGSQFGGVIFPPIVAYEISQFGWRYTVAGLGVFVAIAVMLLAYFFVFDSPDSKNLQPDGDTKQHKAKPEVKDAVLEKVELESFSIWSIYRNVLFLTVVLTMGLMCAIYSGLLPHQILIVLDKGEVLEKGAMMVSVLSIVGMISSPVMGKLCDFFSVKTNLILMCTMAITSLSLYFTANSYGVLVLAAILLGFFGGGVVPIWSSSISRLFSQEHYGRIFGASTSVVYTFAAIASPIIGFTHDLQGSYQSTFVFLAIMCLVAIFFISILGKSKINPSANIKVT